MCSNKWAKPVRPGNSFAGPTWYHKFTATMGKRWSSERMTSRPFSSLYFSNFSCGTSSGADLATAGFAAVCAGAFAGDPAGVCADNEFAQASKANKPNDNAFLRRSLIACPLEMAQYDD